MEHITNNIDLLAFLTFIFSWVGYSGYLKIFKKNKDNLYGIMLDYRLKWMKDCLKREDKSVDATTLGNLMRSVSFFASTSILIIAGLIPLLTYGDKIINFVSDITFLGGKSEVAYELKILLLIIIFIYSFFKYTWALRQYNYASILIFTPIDSHEDYNNAVIRNAKILANAARHFSMGIRSYYFGTVALSWFLSPYLLICSSILVFLINYRREYLSKALDIISN